MQQRNVTVECDSCGVMIGFPDSQRGTVQECPACADFVDVPVDGVAVSERPVVGNFVESNHQLYIESAGQFLGLDVECGLPHPRWDEFNESVSEPAEESQLDGVYREAGRLWLDELCRMLPGGYEVSEADEFYLLSHPARTNARFTLEFCERTRRTILDFLSGVAADEGYGKHIVLAFADTETYYSYVGYYFPDGDWGGSAGMFFGEGYGHTACIAGWSLLRTIAHELTHCLLSHMPLPLWLNEGVTQIAEDKIMGDSWFQPESLDLRRISDYWQERGLDGFWDGISFMASDDGQELSYLFARILVTRLFLEDATRFWQFVSVADHSDSGRAAYSEAFGSSLEQFAMGYVNRRIPRNN